MEWKYANYMKNIFPSIGLDHYYYGNFNTNIFKHIFGKAVQDKELSRRLEMRSQSNYNTFNISPYIINLAFCCWKKKSLFPMNIVVDGYSLGVFSS